MKYHLPVTEKRKCDIKVYQEQIVFEGDFWYLKEKEFYPRKQKTEVGLIKNFLGMGYLNKRSYKKCLMFVIGGTILSCVKNILDKLNEWIDDANKYLEWFDKAVSLPEWVDIIFNIMTAVCILLGLISFFSKKKVIEFSFTDKRICIPQKSISDAEYSMLYHTIKSI